ncbi:Annexin D1 [Platanthera zijinensis]|uniref:Annexin D1 n=1 Tax=Platanthera zijinensis TaxID=2320716 RepID=A0AAP0G720_9ASPA
MRVVSTSSQRTPLAIASAARVDGGGWNMAHLKGLISRQIRQAYADLFGEDILKSLDKELRHDFE